MFWLFKKNPTNLELGFTKLIMANKIWNKEYLEILLKTWININRQDENWASALMFACINWNTEITEWLIENWADINLQSKNWRTAIERAITNDNNEIEKLLTSHKKSK